MTIQSSASITNQPSSNSSISVPATVTVQPSSCSPFAACFAVKNTADNVITKVKEDWSKSTEVEKVQAKAYFCTSLPIGAATYVGALTVLPMTAIGIAGAALAGIASGSTTGFTSAAIAKNNHEQTELKISKKQ